MPSSYYLSGSISSELVMSHLALSCRAIHAVSLERLGKMNAVFHPWPIPVFHVAGKAPHAEAPGSVHSLS
jgi:hypothetical protein